jgi:diguanylate cyclase (GGDEF)-like protein
VAFELRFQWANGADGTCIGITQVVFGDEFMQFESATSSLVLAAIGGLLATATVCGFVAGLLCAPWWQEWALRRAARRVQTLHQLMLDELVRVERVCRLMNTAAGGKLPTPAWEQLEKARHQFQEAWRQTAERHAPSEEVAENATPRPSAKPFRVEWHLVEGDAARQADRHRFDDNLTKLLEATTTHAQPSGLLLVRMDKSDQLQKRFGTSVVERLQQRLGEVVQHAARGEDLVCRIAADSFGVLMPAVSPMAGARLAEAVRSAVRQHPFRPDESGPELIVTASFGYGVCLPGEPASLPMDRANEALAKSQTLGRNQLHVHDASHRQLSRVM